MCSSEQISLHEMRTEQSEDQDVREIRWPKMVAKGFRTKPEWRGSCLVQEVLGLCAGPSGPKSLNLCRAEKKDTKEFRNVVEIILKIREPCKNAKGWKVEGEKRGVTKTEECKMLREEFEVGVFKLQIGVWNFAKQRMLED